MSVGEPGFNNGADDDVEEKGASVRHEAKHLEGI